MSRSARGAKTYIVECEKDGKKEIFEFSLYSNKKDVNNYYKAEGYKVLNIKTK
jgi:hypothetical protein